MKKLIALAFIALTGYTTNAQRLDVGANFLFGAPMGDYTFGDNDLSLPLAPGAGTGVNLDVNYWFNDAMSVGIEAGFIGFADNNVNLDGEPAKTAISAIPFSAKFQYYFLENAFRPYVGLGVGYQIVNREITQEFGNLTYEISWNQNGILISPRVGALYQLSDLIAINLNVQYNVLMNSVDGDLEVTTDAFGQKETETFEDIKGDATNYLGINVGVVFSLFNK